MQKLNINREVESDSFLASSNVPMGSKTGKRKTPGKERDVKVKLWYRGLKRVEGDLKLDCGSNKLIVKDGKSDVVVLQVDRELESAVVTVFDALTLTPHSTFARSPMHLISRARIF
jgi:hypothetical protein